MGEARGHGLRLRERSLAETSKCLRGAVREPSRGCSAVTSGAGECAGRHANHLEQAMCCLNKRYDLCPSCASL